MSDGLEPWGEPGRRRSATSHHPVIVNGRPADLQPLQTLDLARWQGEAVPERRWIVPDMVPEDECTLLSGDGGEGKTLLQLQLAVACVLGRPWLGRTVRKCRVAAVFCEDNSTEIHIRLSDILRHYGATFGDVAEDLAIVCRKGEENALMEWPEWNGPGVPTALSRRVESLVIDHGAELLILDSLHDVFAGEEIKRTHARQFVNALAGIAGRMHGAVFLSMHPSLAGRSSGTGESGSTAWRNACRSMLYLARPPEAAPGSNERELRTKKANRARSGGVIRVTWQDGVFVEDGGNRPAGLVDVLTLDRDLIEGLRHLIQNGALVPADPKAGRGFANAVRDLPSCKRYDWGTVCAAQSRLLDQGRLERVELGPPSRRRVYIRPSGMTYPGEVKGAAE